MSELPKEVRGLTDKLDAVGNTTAAIGKGFAIGSAALTALALFCSFYDHLSSEWLMFPNQWSAALLTDRRVFAILFSSLALGAVGRAAVDDMIQEVRRPFSEIPQLKAALRLWKKIRRQRNTVSGPHPIKKSLTTRHGKAEYSKMLRFLPKLPSGEMVLPGMIAVPTR